MTIAADVREVNNDDAQPENGACGSFWRLAFSGSVAIDARAETQAPDPLPSWNDGPTKQSILDFVAAVTKEGGPDYVAPAERIATFDNDGTLWIEQPIYTQFAFAIDRVKAMSNQHPEWKTKEPFASILKGDLKGLAASGEKGMLEIVAATHSGMTTADFNKTVKEWLATAKHPRFKVLYTDLVYQPMIELLDYLRANGFKTFIVSGGGVEFMRAFADKTYGIPPEQVIGSSGVTAISDVGRKPGADQDAEGAVRRRRAGQAGGHRTLHRPAPDLRLRQFQRRQGDAGVDRGRRRLALHGARLSYRRRARICLRPGGGSPTPSVGNSRKALDGRGDRQGLDDRRHEERLEDDLPAGEGCSLRLCEVPGTMAGHDEALVVGV